jgi:hypothetical protein
MEEAPDNGKESSHCALPTNERFIIITIVLSASDSPCLPTIQQQSVLQAGMKHKQKLHYSDFPAFILCHLLEVVG